MKIHLNFTFGFVSKEHVLEEMEMLDSSQAVQESDTPVKIIKGKIDPFAEVACTFF